MPEFLAAQYLRQIINNAYVNLLDNLKVTLLPKFATSGLLGPLLEKAFEVGNTNLCWAISTFAKYNSMHMVSRPA